MAKTWGVAQFYGFSGMGLMKYLMESGEWLTDRELFDGAPIELFESMKEADERAAQLPQDVQPHGVQFMVDKQGKVLTARRNK